MTRDQVKGTRMRHNGTARHCMVVHAYYPLGETRVEREAHSLIKRGHEVDVICLRFKNELAFETVDRVQVYRLPVQRHKDRGFYMQLLEYLAFFILAFIQLTRLHRQRRYSVVQVHNLPDFLIFAALFPKLSGAKLILDLHDLMPEFYAERFQKSINSLPVRLVCWQEQLACRLADHVITVTEHWRQTLIRRGVPPEKCTVVMNLADGRIFQPSSNNRHFGRNDGCFRLIYHGYMPERYGLDLVLRAMDQVRHQIPGIHLTLVGGGEYLETLKDLAEVLNLKENYVEFRSSVPADQLPPLIAAADIGVVPYRNDVFTDSLLPTKLMEYALMGLPAIAAHTSAISAYFDDTMVQFFTPEDIDDLAHCILTLHNDRARLAQLAKGIGKFNQHYNWTKSGAEYVALVEELGTR